MRSVRRFGYTVLLSILTATDCLCFMWLLSLCGSIHETLAKAQGAVPLGQYLGRLAAEGDFWRALVFFLLTSAALAAVVLLLHRARRARRAEVEGQKLCENETEWEEQP